MLTSKNIIGNYKRIITKNHNISLSSNAEMILDAIKANDISNINEYSINNKDVDNILEELSIYDFMYDSVCIMTLFKRILNRHDNNDYLSNFYCYLTSYKIDFIKRLIDENTDILKKSADFLDVLIDYIDINNIEIEKEYKEKIICSTIAYSRKGSEITRKVIVDYFSNTNNIEEIINNNYNLLKENLKGFNITFNQNEFSDNLKYEKVYKYIMGNDMYGYNFYLLYYAFKVLGYKFRLNHILEDLYNLKDKMSNVTTKMFSNINKTLEKIEELSIRQEDDENVLKLIFNDNKIRLEIKEQEKIIDLEDIIFNDINWIPKVCYKNLVLKNKIYINWKNLNILASNDIIDEKFGFLLEHNNIIEEDNINDIYNMLLEEKTNNIEFILFVIKKLPLDLSKKIELLVEYNKLLGKKNILDCLKSFGGDYEKFIIASGYTFEKNDYNLKLLEMLKEYKLVEKIKPLTNRIRITRGVGIK